MVKDHHVIDLVLVQQCATGLMTYPRHHNETKRRIEKEKKSRRNQKQQQQRNIPLTNQRNPYTSNKSTLIQIKKNERTKRN